MGFPVWWTKNGQDQRAVVSPSAILPQRFHSMVVSKDTSKLADGFWRILMDSEAPRNALNASRITHSPPRPSRLRLRELSTVCQTQLPARLACSDTPRVTTTSDSDSKMRSMKSLMYRWFHLWVNYMWYICRSIYRVISATIKPPIFDGISPLISGSTRRWSTFHS